MEDQFRAEIAQCKKDNDGLKNALGDQELRIQKAQKENDDLKYDNTLLYEKNVQKDHILYENEEEIKNLKEQNSQLREKLMEAESNFRNAQERLLDA